MPIPRVAPTWRCPEHVQVALPYLAKTAKVNVDTLLYFFSSVDGSSCSSSLAECWRCSDLRAQCQVCLSCARVCTSLGTLYYGVLCQFTKHTVSIKAGNWPAKKLNCCQATVLMIQKWQAPKNKSQLTTIWHRLQPSWHDLRSQRSQVLRGLVILDKWGDWGG